MSTIFQVIQVALVGISLAFKGNVAVSVAAHGQSHQPLDAIGQIKENNKHLALLGSVDALVVHQLIAQVNAGMHKKHSQQINRCESLERQYFCPEYLQRYKGNAFYGFSQPQRAVSVLSQFHYNSFGTLFQAGSGEGKEGNGHVGNGSQRGGTDDECRSSCHNVINQ